MSTSSVDHAIQDGVEVVDHRQIQPEAVVEQPSHEIFRTVRKQAAPGPAGEEACKAATDGLGERTQPHPTL